MEQIATIEDGVERLLTFRKRPVPDFFLESRDGTNYLDTLIWNGNRIPLFESHFDPQIRAVAQYGQNVAENCALNTYSFCGKDVSLAELIFREVDISEFILHSKIRKVMGFVNGNAANIICVMENGTCANIDMGCTMAPGTGNQSQHRLITKHGMANDRVVADMVPQHQVYVFGSQKCDADYYDDVDMYLYGLNEEDSRKALAIHAIITGQEVWTEWRSNQDRCMRVVEAVFESSRTCTPVYL